MSYPILVSSSSFGYGAQTDDLVDLFSQYQLEPTFLPLEQAANTIDRYIGIIIGTAKLNQQSIKEAKQLKVIVKYGVGTDNIDIETARNLGISILNLPGINADTVAELALALMLSLARNIIPGDRSVRNGGWERTLGHSVHGKTLGILGTGSIGTSLLRMVSGMRMTVLGYDLYPSNEFISNGGRYVDLDELLACSDFVSIHIPHTSKTAHFMNQERFMMMKPGSYLINTSRGGVVDEAALKEFLVNGHLSGAGLDVFEKEPPDLGILADMEQVVFTPHVGAYTHETLRNMDKACVRAMSEALSNL